MSRQCRNCEVVKSLDMFPGSKHLVCRECQNAKKREQRLVAKTEKPKSVLQNLATKLSDCVDKYEDGKKEWKDIVEALKEFAFTCGLVKNNLHNLTPVERVAITNPIKSPDECERHLDNIEYVYVITSPDFYPTKFKVGKHRGRPNKLNNRYKTYLPHVEIVILQGITHSEIHEANIHKKLEKYRIINSEWYLIDRDTICNIVNEYFTELTILSKIKSAQPESISSQPEAASQ